MSTTYNPPKTSPTEPGAHKMGYQCAKGKEITNAAGPKPNRPKPVYARLTNAVAVTRERERQRVVMLRDRYSSSKPVLDGLY